MFECACLCNRVRLVRGVFVCVLVCECVCVDQTSAGCSCADKSNRLCLVAPCVCSRAAYHRNININCFIIIFCGLCYYFILIFWLLMCMPYL